MMFQDVKVIAAAVALLMLFAGGFYVDHLANKAARVDRAEAATAKLGREFNDYKTAQTQLDGERAAASKGYENEIATLRAAADSRPVPVVRLCASTHSGMPATAHAAGGPDPSTAGAGVLHEGTGQDRHEGADIGPELARLMTRADELSAQLRAVLAFYGVT